MIPLSYRLCTLVLIDCPRFRQHKVLINQPWMRVYKFVDMNYSTTDASGMAMKSSVLNFQDSDLLWSIDAHIEDNTVVPSSNQLLSVSAEIAAHPLTELSALHPSFCFSSTQMQPVNRPDHDSPASSPSPSISYEQLQYGREKQRPGIRSKRLNDTTTKEEEDFEIPTTDDWIKSKQRRREQNRNAQRAHRRRKEAQIESLNAELEIVRSEKEDLKKLSSDQRQEIVQLKSRISQLANQLKTLCLS